MKELGKIIISEEKNKSDFLYDYRQTHEQEIMDDFASRADF